MESKLVFVLTSYNWWVSPLFLPRLFSFLSPKALSPEYTAIATILFIVILSILTKHSQDLLSLFYYWSLVLTINSFQSDESNTSKAFQENPKRMLTKVPNLFYGNLSIWLVVWSPVSLFNDQRCLRFHKVLPLPNWLHQVVLLFLLTKSYPLFSQLVVIQIVFSNAFFIIFNYLEILMKFVFL